MATIGKCYTTPCCVDFVTLAGIAGLGLFGGLTCIYAGSELNNVCKR